MHFLKLGASLTVVLNSALVNAQNPSSVASEAVNLNRRQTFNNAPMIFYDPEANGLAGACGQFHTAHEFVSHH